MIVDTRVDFNALGDVMCATTNTNPLVSIGNNELKQVQ